jgi:8-oxo-dGTP diphosphatase
MVKGLFAAKHTLHNDEPTKIPREPNCRVAGVVVSSKGLLLMKRSKPPYEGLWNIISGAVKVGETQEEAIVREVREESGLESQVIRFLDTSDLIVKDSQWRIEYHYMVNVYLLLASSHALDSADEARDIKWFNPGSIPTSKMPTDVSQALRRIQDQLLQLIEQTGNTG